MKQFICNLYLFSKINLFIAVLLIGLQSCLKAQNNSEGLYSSSNTLYQVEIPQSITFCGEFIDLTRFDRRERMDKELLAFTYMHSNSIQIIKRANRYFPEIENILKSNGIPDDFKYLMTIESNLNPLAHSRAGASGLWQLMPETAREFGLEVNNHIDERYHLEKATLAACKYLKQAYARFGNWTNAAASYNAGQGRISKELNKQYENQVLNLSLVEETSRYVYRILAAKIMLQNPQLFGFHLRRRDLYPPIPFREITIKKNIEDLPLFAKEKGINYALLKSMNPWIIGKSLPVNSNRNYIIRIPDQEGMYYNPEFSFCHNKQWVVD